MKHKHCPLCGRACGRVNRRADKCTRKSRAYWRRFSRISHKSRLTPRRRRLDPHQRTLERRRWRYKLKKLLAELEALPQSRGRVKLADVLELFRQLTSPVRA